MENDQLQKELVVYRRFADYVVRSNRLRLTNGDGDLTDAERNWMDEFAFFHQERLANEKNLQDLMKHVK